jgi:hypothetical protein
VTKNSAPPGTATSPGQGRLVDAPHGYLAFVRDHSFTQTNTDNGLEVIASPVTVIYPNMNASAGTYNCSSTSDIRAKAINARIDRGACEQDNNFYPPGDHLAMSWKQ